MSIFNNKSGQSRSTEELIITFSCVACAVIVAPFAVMRAMDGDSTLAIIDLIIVLGVSLIAVLTWKSHNINLSRWLFALYCAIAVIASVYAKGPASLNWVHPMMMISFFLLSVRYAISLNLVVLLLLLPVIYQVKGSNEMSVIVGAMVMTSVVAYIFASRTNHQRKLLAKIATIDYLTDAENRRAFSKKLRECIELKRRSGSATSVILFDLDFFKAVNDSHGHAVGDQLLINVCDLVRNNIRLTDRLYRHGGEEFIILLPNAALEEANLISEKLRVAIIEDDLMSGYQVTASFGVAELKEDENEDQCMSRVDRALYQSKNEGRNRTTLAA